MIATKRRSPNRKWTALEDKWLTKEYATSQTKDIAAALDRPVASIRRRAQQLGLISNELWSAAEDERLRLLYPDKKQYSIEQIASRLGRDRLSVLNRARTLGLRRDRPTGTQQRYTEAEDEIIKQWYLDLDRPVADLAKRLGRSVKSVTSRALRQLDLPRRKDLRREAGRRNEWHPWRIEEEARNAQPQGQQR